MPLSDKLVFGTQGYISHFIIEILMKVNIENKNKYIIPDVLLME